MEAIARLGAAECLALRDHDRRRRELPRRGGDRLRRRSACARSSTSRSSGRRDGRSPSASSRTAERDRRLALRPRPARRSRRTRPTPSRSSCTRRARARPAGRDAPRRERGRARVALTAPATARRSPSGSAVRRRRPASGCSRSTGCSRPRRRRPLRPRRRRGDRAARRARRRRRALPALERLLGCGIAPLRELLEAGIRVGLGTDSPASTPSFDMFEELRTCVIAGARARAQRPDALSARPGAGARDPRLGARARARRRDRLARPRQARRPRSRVARRLTAFLPWEDPAAAVVFGGSPGRVAPTLVDGEPRYRKGGMRMARADQTQRQRARAAAAGSTAGSGSAQAIEDTMFFPRLRRHAKWVFVLLALVFALSFVFFGVGAGGTGIGDILRGGGGSSATRRPSSRSAQARRGEPERRRGAARPRDGAPARRPDRRGDRRLERYTRARAQGHRRAARARGALPRARGSATRRSWRSCRRSSQRRRRHPAAVDDAARQGDRRSASDPVAAGACRPGEPVVNDALTQMQRHDRQAQDVYERVVVLEPERPAVQLELAAAQNAGDTRPRSRRTRSS